MHEHYMYIKKIIIKINANLKHLTYNNNNNEGKLDMGQTVAKKPALTSLNDFCIIHIKFLI